HPKAEEHLQLQCSIFHISQESNEKNHGNCEQQVTHTNTGDNCATVSIVVTVIFRLVAQKKMDFNIRKNTNWIDRRVGKR
ncbi:hypothetical protein M5D96_002959, partial [Drosophila gunungcola]